MKIEAKLAQMGLKLPEVGAPAGLYVPAKRIGNLIYLSGQTPDIDGVTQYCGTLGRDVSLEDGYKAAQLAGLNLLAVLKQELGDLDRVKNFVQVLGYVQSTPQGGRKRSFRPPFLCARPRRFALATLISSASGAFFSPSTP